jgi:phage tail sheath gpL-like
MTIPTNLRAPIMAIEFDPSRAFQGPAILQHEALIMGNRLTAGTVAEAVIYRATSADEVAEKSGEGSVLHAMAVAWFRNNKLNPAYFCGLDDAAAGVAATGTVTFSGTATAAGTVYLYVAGRLITAAVAVGDTATDVGDSVVAAVALETDLLVTSANVTGVVTFTARNDGEQGNDIDVRLNYNDGDVLPVGVTAVVVGMASGATNPDVQDILDILGDTWYQEFVGPWIDATNLTAIETELADRFGALRMIDGLYYSAMSDTLSNLSTFGNGRNSPHVSIPEATDTISTPFEMAAMYAGQIAAEASADPARPFQTLELIGAVPAPITEQFTYAERNTLLFDGIATVQVATGGVMRIERAISMYQKNAVAADDIAYLDVNTLVTLMYLRYDFRNSILTRYPRAKLANDGVRVAPGQQIITPAVGKAEALAKFRQWESLGLVENFSQFKNDLICERSSTDPNRLNWILPPDLINQFRVGGATIQFLLESPAV